ncbi:DUF1697 domain-containing protein [Massilia sp. TS11]|uniref:DUF1697 domain-containing protein n=1 Tax=Massilia sp. TS11 TaxID=2908003 RepID=UPI001EDAD0CA|nr:DUF1697 domain-containing protein [Massilia sp. TS11]MCG2586577.1 DUF1697 domain-containing protein [Massilia sp. TS11]
MSTTYIALLRGINVGGKNLLPMKSLAAPMEAIGCQAVRTYIQNGNVVFQHAEASPAALARAIGAAIGQTHGFTPDVLVLSAAELQQAIAANPYPEASAAPTSLHFGFLAAAPASARMDKLDALASNGERYQIIGQVFYLHAPAGIGKSKLAAGAERAIGVPMTARNWNTVAKLADMCAQM